MFHSVSTLGPCISVMLFVTNKMFRATKLTQFKHVQTQSRRAEKHKHYYSRTIIANGGYNTSFKRKLAPQHKRHGGSLGIHMKGFSKSSQRQPTTTSHLCWRVGPYYLK